MEIGSFIKLQRVKQGMTQEELASGIVSMSYLSKIENQRTEASPEVISLLCTRLGVEVDNEMDLTIKEKCERWYGLLFEVSDKKELIESYNEINELLSSVSSNSLVLFEIHKIRYYLILGDIDRALEQINNLNEITNTFDSLHQFYWYKFKGNYASVIGDFNQALKMYQLSAEKLHQLDITEEETADLYYTIAVTHSKVRNTLESIDYADMAIDIFRKEYNFIRCAQCHIVLGISYRRLNMFEKAIKNYNLAKHLGKLDRNKQIIQLANVNLGYLHSAKGDSRGAIHFYDEVANDDEVDLNARITALTSLIKEYFSIGDFEKTREGIEQCYELLKDFTNKEAFEMHHYVLQTYAHAINKEHEKFESIVIDEFIPYLQNHKENAFLVVFANMLGAHFEELGRYKDSVKYYKLANLTYEKLISL